MLLRRAASRIAAAHTQRAAHRTVAVAASTRLTSLLTVRMESSVREVKTAAAAAATTHAASTAHGSSAAPTLPVLPPTQLSYVTADNLSAKDRAALQAVALFVTEEELASTLAAARGADGADGAALSIDALLAAAGDGASESSGLFDGAETHAPSSHIWSDFKAKAGETLWVYPSAAASGKKSAATQSSYPRLLLVGLGPAAKVQMSSYRSATWKAVNSFQNASLLERVGVVLPQPPVVARYFDSHLSQEIDATVARMAALSNHSFRKHLSPESVTKRKKGAIAAIDLIDLAPLSTSGSNSPSAATASTKGRRRGRGTAAAGGASPVAAAAAAGSSPLGGRVVEDRADIVRTQHAVATATALAREWANERGDIATPLWMEQQARLIAEKHGLGFIVLQDEDLAREGLELIRAVGRGATHKARIVILEYKGKNQQQLQQQQGTAQKSATATATVTDSSSSSSAPLNNITALVGKGVTFDTGGLLIKGRGNMEGMHLDMSGSACVLGVLAGLSATGYSGTVVGVLALAENAVSAEAFKPLSILPSVQGSVEIIDTDAEGRLVLADALTLVQRRFKPNKIVDLATLTGACVVALGENRAGLFANDPESGSSSNADGSATATSETASSSSQQQSLEGSLPSALISSGERVGERLWRLPIDDSHRDEIKGTHADLRNCAPARWGGACVAAAFLEKFINPGVAWAHIDLAGPAMRSKAAEWQCEGGTGYGTQLLLDYFQRQERFQTDKVAVEQVRLALLQGFKENKLGQEQE